MFPKTAESQSKRKVVTKMLYINSNFVTQPSFFTGLPTYRFFWEQGKDELTRKPSKSKRLIRKKHLRPDGGFEKNKKWRPTIRLSASQANHSAELIEISWGRRAFFWQSCRPARISFFLMSPELIPPYWQAQSSLETAIACMLL